jgi:integrase
VRGSVYYQSSQLVKSIFKAGVKKKDRIDSKHENYKCITSYNTMDTYRKVWNNFFNYLLEHWNLKNCENITNEHVAAYFYYKIEYYPSKQYVEKISSALGALEIALNKYAKMKYEEPNSYDFKIRQDILNEARNLKLVATYNKSRVYENAKQIIENLSCEEHQIAAFIQTIGGARLEGVGYIKKEKLKGFKIDKITNKEVGVIETKEKGGKIGDVLVDAQSYVFIRAYIENNEGIFKINKQKYSNDIRETCIKLNVQPHGSHGFRWTFAQNRVREYQNHGYSYEQAIQGVSWEMKHFRADITEHYLG